MGTLPDETTAVKHERSHACPTLGVQTGIAALLT
jgi:hypothetical protein